MSEELCVLDGEENIEDMLFGDMWELIDAASEGLGKAPKEPLVTDHYEAPAGEGINVEDFEGFEQYLFTVLKDNVRAASNVNSSLAVRKKAAEWIFVSHQPNSKGVMFADTCRALGARRTVLQARVQYQLYAAGVPYPEPLPFLCDPLSETLCAEILYQHGEDAMNLAKFLWKWPGIRADILATEAESRLGLTPERTLAMMTRLEDSGHAALKHGFWFFISRNPAMISVAGRRTFQWSKSFVGAFD